MSETKEARPTIEQLEAMLERDEDCAIEILPNVEIRRRDDLEGRPDSVLNPLTMRENLGGEYARAA